MKRFMSLVCAVALVGLMAMGLMAPQKAQAQAPTIGITTTIYVYQSDPTHSDPYTTPHDEITCSWYFDNIVNWRQYYIDFSFWTNWGAAITQGGPQETVTAVFDYAEDSNDYVIMNGLVALKPSDVGGSDTFTESACAHSIYFCWPDAYSSPTNSHDVEAYLNPGDNVGFTISDWYSAIHFSNSSVRTIHYHYVLTTKIRLPDNSYSQTVTESTSIISQKYY